MKFRLFPILIVTNFLFKAKGRIIYPFIYSFYCFINILLKALKTCTKHTNLHASITIFFFILFLDIISRFTFTSPHLNSKDSSKDQKPTIAKDEDGDYLVERKNSKNLHENVISLGKLSKS